MTRPINQYLKKMKIKPFPQSKIITLIAVPVPGLSNLITVNLYAL
jgi:hypothetical protein